jgi:hypothetical protein
VTGCTRRTATRPCGSAGSRGAGFPNRRASPPTPPTRPTSTPTWPTSSGPTGSRCARRPAATPTGRWPNIRPGRATAAYLSHVCPGRPLAFAVCDQGAAAAFTGLRLIREYTRTGECRRALLIVVEQATLHYDPIAPVALPDAHTGVALLCDDSGPIAVDAVGVHSGTPPSTLPDGATLVLGNGLPPPAGRQARVAPAGHPYTGPWWELAGVLAAGPPGPLLVADYDPVLRYTCLCRLSPVEPDGFEGGTDARLELGAS